MAENKLNQRLEDTLTILKEKGIPIHRAVSIKVDYKEMGEFAGDLVVPVIEIKIPDE